jgi:hypothetical protein
VEITGWDDGALIGRGRGGHVLQAVSMTDGARDCAIKNPENAEWGGEDGSGGRAWKKRRSRA